jgi:uncharacterized protein (DUF427 family)
MARLTRLRFEEIAMVLSTAYEKHPQHQIEIDEEKVGLRVTLHGEVLAETTRGLNLREGNYPAVVYIPREDVHMERLTARDHSTHCPFKGDASYFCSGRKASGEDLAWSYETPFDQMAAIQGHLAFYADRVAIEPFSN